MVTYRLMRFNDFSGEFYVAGEYNSDWKAHQAVFDLQKRAIAGLMHINGNWVVHPNGWWETYDGQLVSYMKAFRAGLKPSVWFTPEDYIRAHLHDADAVFTVRTFDAKGNHFDEPDSIVGFQAAKAYADAKDCSTMLFMKGHRCYVKR